MHVVPRKVWLGVYCFFAIIILLGILSLPTGTPWFTTLVIVEHLVLFAVYAVKVTRGFEEKRQCEIDNISLKRESTNLKQHVNNLLLNLDEHAKFNSEIAKDVDVFCRATGIKHHKTASK